MSTTLAVLLTSTATVALIHTAVGVDHYLPFVVFGRAEGWSLRRTLLWTALCGVGHVFASVALGLIGVGLGWAAGRMDFLQELRGDMAARALIVLGAAYALVGIFLRGRRHTHVHMHDHGDGTSHCHLHPHPTTGPLHDHDDVPHVAAHRRTLWALFLIFVLGPCEPLFALMVAPALHHDVVALVAVVIVFAVVTIAAMLALVTVGYLGVSVVRFAPLQRWGHSLAGLAVMISGLLILFAGL